MTKAELISKLNSVIKDQDTETEGWADEESYHRAADKLLLDYINDPEVTEAFRSIPKWYS